MMKSTKAKIDGNKLSFGVDGTSPQFVNALRRIIIAEMPVMAIESVTFYNNSSIMDDELMAHRLGLIPLTTDLKTYNSPSECTCEGKGCGKCTAILTLEAKGPGTVHSKELKTTDPKIKPVYDTIPIIKLLEGHEIKLEAKAVLGSGRDHMKWQGGLATYEEKKPGSYEFTVESFGQLPPKEMLSHAFDIFEQKLKEIKTQLK